MKKDHFSFLDAVDAQSGHGTWPSLAYLQGSLAWGSRKTRRVFLDLDGYWVERANEREIRLTTEGFKRLREEHDRQ